MQHTRSTLIDKILPETLNLNKAKKALGPPMKRLSLILTTVCLGSCPLLAQGWTSCCIEEDSCDLFFADNNQPWTFFGEFLYWKAQEDRLVYAASLKGGLNPALAFFASPAPEELTEKISIKQAKQEWSPGFRVGGSYASCCSSWEMHLFWTELHNTTHASVTNKDFGIFSSESPASMLFNLTHTTPSLGSGARTEWKLRFDTIDLEIGKSFLLCNCIKMYTFVGVKAAQINQKLATRYQGFSLQTAPGAPFFPVASKVTKKNNFRSIGPTFGVTSQWSFGCNWALDSGFTAGLLYGKFDNKITTTFDVEAIQKKLNFVIDDDYTRVRPMVSGFIGLDWHSCFQECWSLGIGVGYEVQYFWNQWQSSPSAELSTVNASQSPQGDLMMQGLVVHAAIGF
jgi:hypothetical protein